MLPEDRAALVVWRIMAPSLPIEEFTRCLTTSRRPEWNQAVRLVADAIREAVTKAIGDTMVVLRNEPIMVWEDQAGYYQPDGSST